MRFISFNRLVACSSLMPPDRNTTPGTSVGTCAVRHLIVASAIETSSSCVAQAFPGTTMFTLRSEPGRSTRAVASAA